MANSENNQNGKSKSVIKTIMVEQEEKTRTSLDPLTVVISALGVLKERERDVLMNRFSLSGGKKTTLEAIGQKLQITRERVRQIETAAVKRLANNPSKDLIQLMKVINSFMTSNGGLTDLNGLANYLKVDGDQQAEAEINALRLIMSVDSRLVLLKKNSSLKMGWIQRNFPIDILIPTIEEIKEILKKNDKPMGVDAIWEEFKSTDFMAKNENKITPLVVVGAMHVAEEVALTTEGEWGLSSWPIVVPKRIRDKVYLVLKHNDEPMHFADISTAINQNYPEKQVLSRTVHNELIGDDRFVLVGRGIYALKAWGYKPGVVADVIQEILKKAKEPMTTNEIIEAVLNTRQVKKNTVVANLQNRKLFRKVGRGTYTLA